MTQEELKPCPFCGGEAYVHRASSGYGYGIACHSCNISLKPREYKDAAIEQWNRRTPAPLRRYRVGVDELPKESGFYNLYTTGGFSDLIEFTPNEYTPRSFWYHGHSGKFTLEDNWIIEGPVVPTKRDDLQIQWFEMPAKRQSHCKINDLWKNFTKLYGPIEAEGGAEHA